MKIMPPTMKMGNVYRNLAVLLLLAILAACAPATAPAATAALPGEALAPDPGLTILAFGDSLTEGFGVEPQDSYPAQLERKLQAGGLDVRVINGGISGETSSAALARLDWMLNTNPDIVIVETGGNDALRGVDLGLTRQNIDEIVRRFSEHGAVVIVAGLQIIQNLGDDYTAEFAAIYPAVAEKYDSILIPFVLEGVAADPALNQPDFIHPTAQGYTVMVEHIHPFVLEAVRRAQTR